MPLQQLAGLEIGTDESAGADAVFHDPLDAAFIGDRIAVLDASAPYLRLFSGTGEFVGAAGRRGRGPGELTRPLGIGAVNGRIVVAEADRWVSFDAQGEPIHTETQTDRMLRGVSGACGDDVVVLAGERGRFEPPAAVTIGQAYGDTIAVVGTLRSNNQRVHPFLVSSSDSLVVLYAEGVDEHHLVVFDCTSREARYLAIESVGRQEHFEATGPTSHALHPAAVPRPAGIAQYRGTIFWFVNDERESNGTSTRVTTIARFDGAWHEAVEIEGWYQLADHTADRWLFLAKEPLPRVILVDPDAILATPAT